MRAHLGMSALAPSLVRLIDTKNEPYAEIQNTLTKVSEHLYNTVLLSGKIIEEIGAFSTSNHNVKGTSGFDDIFQTDSNPYVFKFAAKLSEVRLHVERLQIIRNHQVLTFTTIGKDLAAHKEAYVLLIQIPANLHDVLCMFFLLTTLTFFIFAFTLKFCLVGSSSSNIV